jgi:hypothetical protein
LSFTAKSGDETVSLVNKVREAEAKASASCDPSDWAVYHALSAALRAESDELLNAAMPRETPDLSGLPSPAESGFVSEVRIHRGGTEN